MKVNRKIILYIIIFPIKWKDLLNKNNGYINENNGRLKIEFHMNMTFKIKLLINKCL